MGYKSKDFSSRIQIAKHDTSVVFFSGVMCFLKAEWQLHNKRLSLILLSWLITENLVVATLKLSDDDQHYKKLTQNRNKQFFALYYSIRKI